MRFIYYVGVRFDFRKGKFFILYLKQEEGFFSTNWQIIKKEPRQSRRSSFHLKMRNEIISYDYRNGS